MDKIILNTIGDKTECKLCCENGWVYLMRTFPMYAYQSEMGMFILQHLSSVDTIEFNDKLVMKSVYQVLVREAKFFKFEFDNNKIKVSHV